MGSNKVITIYGIHYKTGEPVAITVAGGSIVEISEVHETGSIVDLPWVGPGLVDVQINGYSGIDFNTVPITRDKYCQVSRNLWQEGITTYFPTVVTSSPEIIRNNMIAINEACLTDEAARSMIGGIHLEGPFITPEDGARGVHAKNYIRPPDWDLFSDWQQASGGRIKLVTLSPEWPESEAFIRRCTDSGVLVSIGHTSAEPGQIQQAVKAGARMSTHLGNGTHLMLPRHPNYLWEQLSEDRLSISIIADGFHLPESVIKVMLRTKGDKVIVTSDASFISGLLPGEYSTDIGGHVTLTSEGRLHLSHNPQLLAGSAQMQIKAIEHLTNSKLANLTTAWDMCSVRPAHLLGLSTRNGLEEGAPADMVVFRRHDANIRVLRTYKNGRLVYENKML